MNIRTGNRMLAMYTGLWLATVISLGNLCSASYIPGFLPSTYAEGDPAPLLVNSLNPTLLQDQKLKSLISYDCSQTLL